ncbi:hypothetical protein J4421_06660 [Candidatus Woesearchaeota archaeon]|nr:hypothetical protein [Candidatus Woesearchaeota archaeon]
MAKQKKSTSEEVLEQLGIIGNATEKITKKVLEKAITKGLPALNKGLKKVSEALNDWVKE